MKKFFRKLFRKKKLKNARTMDNLSKILSPERPILMGLLQKYTNVMKGEGIEKLVPLLLKSITFEFFAKGYQTRFCRVDAENGILSYYLNETDEQMVPRGKVQLIGALGN